MTKGEKKSKWLLRILIMALACALLWELWGETCITNSAHHQAVDHLGHDLQAVQWAPDGTVEALLHRALPIWAVQWHPERLCGPLAKAGAADGGRLFGAWLQLCAQTGELVKN